jgi:hypothetical protein
MHQQSLHQDQKPQFFPLLPSPRRLFLLLTREEKFVLLLGLGIAFA